MKRLLSAELTVQYLGGPTIQATLLRPSDTPSICVLFGPSGCGKTTILRCLAGLQRPSAGRIACGEQVWFDASRRIHLRPQARGIGLMSQDYALFPHLTVAQNVAYGLFREPSAARESRTADLLRRFGLEELAARRPEETSGGQRQRVALARALAPRPRVLLLDEPLAALDEATRTTLRSELRRELRACGIPVLLVTHDRVEAMALADEVIVMRDGAVLQTGGVQTVFSRPVSAAVAQIVGVENMLPGEVAEARDDLATVRVGGTHVVGMANEATQSGNKVFACFRPEEVVLAGERPAESSVRNAWAATVLELVPEGPLVRVELQAGVQFTAFVTRHAAADLRLEPGRMLYALLKAQSVHFVPREGAT